MRWLVSFGALGVFVGLAAGSAEPTIPDPEGLQRDNYSPPMADLPDAPHGLPGWLAFPARSDANPGGPAFEGAQWVIFLGSPDELTAWQKVPEGGRVKLLHAGGRVDATLVGAGDRPYGCDDVPTPMVGLAVEGDTDGEIGLVLASAPRLRPREIAQTGTPREGARGWTAGQLQLHLARTKEFEAELTVRRTAQLVHTSSHEKYLMDGAEPSGIDLSSEYFDVGMPRPIGVWAEGSDHYLVLFETQGYEGWGVDALTIDGSDSTMQDVLGVYRCAF